MTLDPDCFAYLAAGRSILNGFKMYSDFYLNKAPGLYLLPALLLKGGNGLFEFMQFEGVVFFLTSVLATLLLHIRCNGTFELLSGFSILTVFQIFTFKWTGQIQAESISIFGCFLFTLGVLIESRVWSIVTMTAAILIILFFKEPALLIALSMGVAVGNRKGQVYQMITSCFLAGATFLALSLYLDFLRDYVYVYQHDVWTHLVWRASPTNPLLRIVDLHIPAKKIWSSSRWLSLLFLVLLLNHIILQFYRLFGQNKWRPLVFSFCSFYVVSFTIGIGSTYWYHHLALLWPFMFAIFLDSIKSDLLVGRTSYYFLYFAGLITISAAGLIWQGGLIRNTDNRKLNESRLLAAAIDQIIERCGFSSYGYLGGGKEYPPFAFSKFSPIGPLFFQIWDNQPDNLRSRWVENMTRADLIVAHKNVNELMKIKDWAQIRKLIAEEFTIVAPPCADRLRQRFDDYEIFFKHL